MDIKLFEIKEEHLQYNLILNISLAGIDDIEDKEMLIGHGKKHAIEITISNNYRYIHNFFNTTILACFVYM